MPIQVFLIGAMVAFYLYENSQPAPVVKSEAAKKPPASPGLNADDITGAVSDAFGVIVGLMEEDKEEDEAAGNGVPAEIIEL